MYADIPRARDRCWCQFAREGTRKGAWDIVWGMAASGKVEGTFWMGLELTGIK